MKLKMLRPVIGVTLIVLSVAALIWWENTGRRDFTMESVIVAAEHIGKGEVIGENHFTEIRAMEETMVRGAITPKNFKKIEGNVANQSIPKGAQVTKGMFVKKDQILKEGNSIFLIKESWIDNRSSSLRKGDTIDILDESGNLYMGTFKVAYVKDSDEQEVVGTEENLNEEVLQRDFSSGVISHVEIIAGLDEYEKIREMAEVQQIKVLLVQKGEETVE